MIAYSTPPLPHHTLSAHMVLLAILLTTVVACLDPVGSFLNRVYQRYRQGRWDARKARRQARNRAVNMQRSGFPLKDYQNHQPGEWVPRRYRALFRLRCAGRGYRVSGRR